MYRGIFLREFFAEKAYFWSFFTEIFYLCSIENNRGNFIFMRFTKMHGIGNDYIYVDCMDGSFGGADGAILYDDSRLAEIASKLSDRHCGIGGDGVILILPSEVADFRMRMFNADGSEGRMCGNGSRCVGKYVFDKHHTNKLDITLETLSGIKRLYLLPGGDGKIDKVTVDMGAPILSCEDIPVILPAGVSSTIDIAVTVGGSRMEDSFAVTAVSMGNPHGVVFVDEITDRHVLEIGPKLERHPMWPDRANIEFARVISQSDIEMRVWERGSGETMACGTGACATAVAAMLTGRVKDKDEVTVHLVGGDLHIRWDKQKNKVFMTGPATEVFVGEAEL